MLIQQRLRLAQPSQEFLYLSRMVKKGSATKTRICELAVEYNDLVFGYSKKKE